MTLTTEGLPGFLLYSMDSAMRRLRPPPGTAFLSWVKNSFLKTQLMRGSGSCGELIPKENQSSLRVDAPTYLMAPIGIVLSDLIDSCLFTTSESTMYTAFMVFEWSAGVQRRLRREPTKTRIRGLGLLDLPNFVTSNSPRQEKRTLSCAPSPIEVRTTSPNPPALPIPR